MSIREISEEMLLSLRESISSRMSEKRLRHTLGVEDMAAKIAEIYCPQKKNVLRAAALLHDITKELSIEEQRAIALRYGEGLTEDMENAPSTQHSYTASLIIPQLYPHLASDEIIGAVRYHTTGRADMSLSEKIIYLSDYIDSTRTYPDCVALREMFWGVDIESMDEHERIAHLDRVMLRSFEMTIADLKARNRQISRETAEAWECLNKKINA